VAPLSDPCREFGGIQATLRSQRGVRRLPAGSPRRVFKRHGLEITKLFHASDAPRLANQIPIAEILAPSKLVDRGFLLPSCADLQIHPSKFAAVPPPP
jgi:hypothetical protein